MILLDTHVLLWLDRDDPALGPTSRELIREAWTNGAVAVCAISFWEVAMFAARGRINLRQSPESWRLDWLQAELEEIPLDGANSGSRTSLRRITAMPFAEEPRDAHHWRKGTSSPVV